jgi:choline dehydrogenase-like flavoprotein
MAKRRYRLTVQGELSDHLQRVFPGMELAKVMTFHSLYTLDLRRLLSCPIAEVAVSGWSVADLLTTPGAQPRASGQRIDDEVFHRFAARLSYLSRDFGDAATFDRVGAATGDACIPVFYLEVQPFPFGPVIKGLTGAGLTKTGRVVVEKPFGHDLAFARAVAEEIHAVRKVAHQAGTCRFGSDPATSALNPDCRAHELDNPCVVDTSFFASIGAVKPALTAIANALRVRDHLLKRMGPEWPRPEPAYAA